jgi:hypothetical protein
MVRVRRGNREIPRPLDRGEAARELTHRHRKEERPSGFGIWRFGVRVSYWSKSRVAISRFNGAVDYQGTRGSRSRGESGFGVRGFLHQGNLTGIVDSRSTRNPEGDVAAWDHKG